MPKTIAIKLDKTISEGDTFMVKGKHKVGDKLSISRYFSNIIGKPIADGEVVEDGITAMKTELNGTKFENDENTRKAWSHYFKIKVTKIK